VGPCQVVETRVEVIDGRFVERLQDLPPRVLFDTGQPRRWLRFPERFTYLSPEAIEILADRGVRLLGTDAPSIDPLVSKELSAHHACARRGVRILEGLALEGVAPGTYELVALPLLLEGADAAPVRAILR
jgi:arylformamidase